MNAAFAALELRANTAVIDRLSNRIVTVGALAFDAIFEDQGESVLDGMAEAVEPRLSAVPVETAALLDRGDVLTLTNPTGGLVQSFELVRKVPDGAGFVVLYLRKP